MRGSALRDFAMSRVKASLRSHSLPKNVASNAAMVQMTAAASAPMIAPRSERRFTGAILRAKKPRDPRTGPSSTTPQLSMVMSGYFFFVDFFVAFLAGFFFAAILLTTFHAVRDLPVAPDWHNAPDFSDTALIRLKGETSVDDLRRLLRSASSFWRSSFLLTSICDQ